MLLAAPTAAAAAAADAALRALLTPAGMRVKATLADARRDIRNVHAEWLGFRFRLDGRRFRVRLGEYAFDKLRRRFLLAHAKSNPAARAVRVLNGWVGALGPCYRWENAPAVCGRAAAVARECGFEESLPAGEMIAGWRIARVRWEATRKAVRRTPGYLTTGPLAVPTPTSVVW